MKLQSQMVNALGDKVDDVHSHIININARMKDTLEKVMSIHMK